VDNGVTLEVEDMKIVMLAAAACLLAIPALAHHSFAAEFDG
jgi:hypothetical protein